MLRAFARSLNESPEPVKAHTKHHGLARRMDVGAFLVLGVVHDTQHGVKQESMSSILIGLAASLSAPCSARTGEALPWVPSVRGPDIKGRFDLVVFCLRLQLRALAARNLGVQPAGSVEVGIWFQQGVFAGEFCLVQDFMVLRRKSRDH